MESTGEGATLKPDVTRPLVACRAPARAALVVGTTAQSSSWSCGLQGASRLPHGSAQGGAGRNRIHGGQRLFVAHGISTGRVAGSPAGVEGLTPIVAATLGWRCRSCPHAASSTMLRLRRSSYGSSIWSLWSGDPASSPPATAQHQSLIRTFGGTRGPLLRKRVRAQAATLRRTLRTEEEIVSA